MRLAIIATFVAITTAAHAAEAPPPTAPIQLTEEQIQIVAAALNIAAGTCGQSKAGCFVGLGRDEILLKLQNAETGLHKGPKK